MSIRSVHLWEIYQNGLYLQELKSKTFEINPHLSSDEDLDKKESDAKYDFLLEENFKEFEAIVKSIVNEKIETMTLDNYKGDCSM